MIIKSVLKFFPTCLPSGLTVAAPGAFGRIHGVWLCDKEIGVRSKRFGFDFLSRCGDNRYCLSPTSKLRHG